MIALITARGGSKGVPGKNIKDLMGKPLIVYTIEAAQKARNIDKIILSTDDKKIASIVSEYNVEIPFMRPERLAADDAKAIDNYIYTIDRLNERFEYNITEFIALQPTSPLRTHEDIDRAIDMFYKKNADSVISLCEAPYPPLWLRKITPDGRIGHFFTGGKENVNRQLLEKGFIPNGAIYIFKYSIIKDRYTYYTDRSYAYLMPPERSVDIDTQLDFEFVEFLMKKRMLAVGNRK
jgi:CMP-N,N'-diacetyllegionaminic acid synthase